MVQKNIKEFIKTRVAVAKAAMPMSKNLNKLFEMFMDASNFAVGTILDQEGSIIATFPMKRIEPNGTI